MSRTRITAIGVEKWQISVHRAQEENILTNLLGLEKNEKKNARRGRTMKYSLGEGLGIEGDEDGGNYKLGIKLGTESGQK